MSATPHTVRRAESPSAQHAFQFAGRSGGSRWLLVAAVAMVGSAVLVFVLDAGAPPDAGGANAAVPSPVSADAPDVERWSTERAAAVVHPGAHVVAEALPSDLAPRSEPLDADRERWSEADFYTELLALAGTEAFDRAVASALDRSRPAAERFAALRASYDVHGADSSATFLRAAVELVDSAEPNSESTPRAAVHWLGVRAAREPASREVLEQLCFAPDVDVELRSAGACALLLGAPAADLARLEQRFSREREERIVISVQSALEARRRSADPLEQAPQEP